jgi:Mn2+/Fe2+ NRAMP family transporter
LTLSLFAYVATAFTVDIPWKKALLVAVWPSPTLNSDFLMMVVAVLGTTISPYLFYWQAAQEVEEMRRGSGRRPLKDLVRGGYREIDRITVDTIVGMGISNFIAFFIVLTTAAVLNSAGVTNIQSASQAAEALRPLAGDLTFLLFALGIIGTGLLAVPVLAGSAAYCVAETFHWPATLQAKVPHALGFYGIIIAATAIGFALGFTPLDPIRMLIWSAVLNGIVAVPIMAAMMVIIQNAKLMGRFRGRPWLIFLGWLGTALMAAAVVAMTWSFVKG